ncbi:MAG: HD domain-containing protein [Desulfovibrio sp.]|jgi:3'-5' exoribonuclease|nr:HD domain-containing protein [Desulfovibrio sp.]
MSDRPQENSKRLFAADLKLGTEVADLFLLSAARLNQSANGPYWLLEFKDASGVIPGKIWSPQSRAYPDLAPGLAVFVKGRVGSYRERSDLSIDSLRVLEDAEKAALDLSLFLPSAPRPAGEMSAELRGLALTVLTHAPWRKLVLDLLEDAEIGPLLRSAPAAKAMHHAYAGGLLEHTLSVVRICMFLADHYPFLDRQTLFAGALCHDLGKIWELKQDVAINYTTQGRLIGHINIFTSRLEDFAARAGLEKDLAEHLLHLVLSHHGTYEFGSPRLPASPEAVALHYADNIDAKLKQVQDALSGLAPGSWSDYNTPLERFLYCPPRTPDAPPAPESDPEPVPDCDSGSEPAPVPAAPQEANPVGPDANPAAQEDANPAGKAGGTGKTGTLSLFTIQPASGVLCSSPLKE